MPTLRVYFDGNKLREEHKLTAEGSLRNLKLQTSKGVVGISFNDGEYFTNIASFAGQLAIPDEIKAKITKVTMLESISDPAIVDAVKRGIYRRGSTRATVIGKRELYSSIGAYDTTEVTFEITIEISGRTPKAVLRMYNDILACNINPAQEYGAASKEPTTSGGNES